MIRLKWKLTGMYLMISALAFFLAGVGISVNLKGPAGPGLAGIFLTALVLTAPLVYFIARGFSKRIDELNLGTKSLISELPKGFPDVGDELGELGENIYLVTRKLQSTIREVSQESNKMMAILTGMLEGVVALDHIGRIVLLNRAAGMMFGAGEAEVKGQYLTNLVRDHELGIRLLRVLEKGESTQYEFSLAGRVLRVLMSPVVSSQVVQGAVAVFQDITEIRRLEQIRTEFVANVSHELRTPLTSIKGFVETLLDGADEDPGVRERFLHIIHDETGRLQRLIEDLLTLSHLENKQRSGDGAASAAGAYDKVAQVLIPLARAKNIELRVEAPEDLPRVGMGEELLSQVFLNLMENGIKYTPPGGKVWLEVEEDGEGILIRVGDTGQGIPRESLARIFERFYRVDKARSREMGGTGLGLSIVKHIVEQAKGTLQVESELGRGTVFKIWVPQKTEDSPA